MWVELRIERLKCESSNTRNRMRIMTLSQNPRLELGTGRRKKEESSKDQHMSGDGSCCDWCLISNLEIYLFQSYTMDFHW